MKKEILTFDHIQGLVGSICRDIAVSGWRPDYIVGLVRGGTIPATMISHFLNIPMYTLKVSLRDHADGGESNCWMAEDAFGYNADWTIADVSKRRKILIVDDINDSGATINWILRDWQASCLPGNKEDWASVWNENVKFAVLYDNLASSSIVEMDFVGTEINKAEDDVWIDFPWESWWQR